MVNVKKLLTLGVLLVLGGMAVAQPGQVVSSGFAGQVNQVQAPSTANAAAPTVRNRKNQRRAPLFFGRATGSV